MWQGIYGHLIPSGQSGQQVWVLTEFPFEISVQNFSK
jgi:hypothetical protein